MDRDHETAGQRGPCLARQDCRVRRRRKATGDGRTQLEEFDSSGGEGVKDITPFNPLDKENLGTSVADALVAQTLVPLGDMPKFKGAGIYAIYYFGDFPAYEMLSKGNRNVGQETPIYVGKAVPEGTRKGALRLDAEIGTVLRARLMQHALSIRKAENLQIEDFRCRFLVVDDVWIPLGESLLIARHSPIWNLILDGFGNNKPGRRRESQIRSRWDVMHPGREWAMKCKARDETAEQLAAEIKNHLSQ